jgi:hypothetical protein
VMIELITVLVRRPKAMITWASYSYNVRRR